eukprot:96957_1
MGNTDDVDDHVFDFLKLYGNKLDKNDQYTLQILIDEEDDIAVYMEYTYRLIFKGDLHMVWQAIGSIDGRDFFMVYFCLKGDTNDKYHYHKIGDKDLWFYFRESISAKKWLSAKKYTPKQFEEEILNKYTTSKVGKIMTPKSYIIQLWKLCKKYLKQLKRENPGETDEWYHQHMLRNAKNEKIPFVKEGLHWALFFVFCCLHLKIRVFCHILSNQFSISYIYNDY